MACYCGGFCGAADAQFSRERAEKELRQYNRKGPKSTTRLLRDGLERAGLVHNASLIEVGAGIASLTFELLPLGVKRALVVDASPAYLAVAAEEASQRQLTDVVRFVHADFAESDEPFPPHRSSPWTESCAVTRRIECYWNRQCDVLTELWHSLIHAIDGSCVRVCGSRTRPGRPDFKRSCIPSMT